MRTEGQRQEERIRDALDMCEIHWITTEVPVEKIEEMRDELWEHLREAVRDGKTVESVVGDNPVFFAEEWAAPVRPPKPLLWKVSGWVSVNLSYAAFLLVVGHVWHWSPDFPVTPFLYLNAIGMMLLTSLAFGMGPPMSAGLRFEGTPFRQALLVGGLTALAAAAVVGVNVAVNLAVGGWGVSPLYHWSWPATLIVVVVACFVPPRPKQDLDGLPPRPDQRRRGTRAGG